MFRSHAVITGKVAMRMILALSLATLLGGCGLLKEFKRPTVRFKPADGDSRLVDATRRAIISVKRQVIGEDGRFVIGPNGNPVTDLVVCAEPSPDAIQATASALGLKISGKKKLEALFNLSTSTAESVASIGLRTQTIQLLRDAYYRLCEAYLNDGIDSIAYDVLQRRFQNQIIALLAVEQLTGAVKADQAALSTAAAAEAGAQAGLIAQTLESAEKELLRLQEEQGANEAKLADLKEKEPTLKDAKETADKNLEENRDSSEFEGKAKQANNNLESNVQKLKDAERQKEALKNQIERQQQHIATLITAFGEAAKATIKSSAMSSAVFQKGDTGPHPSPESEVVRAVRAITLSAINQDYEAQVCFETLRYRNNVAQFKNAVTDDSNNTFVKRCEKLMDQQAHLGEARVKVIKAHANAIKTIVEKVGKGDGNISAQDAANLILALSHAVPTVPGTAFLPRKLTIDGPSGDASRPEEEGQRAKPNGQQSSSGNASRTKGEVQGAKPDGQLTK